MVPIILGNPHIVATLEDEGFGFWDDRAWDFAEKCMEKKMKH